MLTIGWRWLLAGFALWALSAPFAARADDQNLTTADRVALQSTMAQYIDQHMVGDAFLHVDTKSGEIVRLYPATQHAMIVRLNQVIVLCADLRMKDGQMVNADFYAMRDNGQFVIFQTEIGNRAPLQALIIKGAASLLE